MKPAAAACVSLLALVAMAHLVRFIAGWAVTINGLPVPTWLSALVAVFIGLLALLLWRESRRG